MPDRQCRRSEAAAPYAASRYQELQIENAIGNMCLPALFPNFVADMPQ
jgi:hypothetical protein